MALINCPECGKEISDQVAACPNCGNPIRKTNLKFCQHCGEQIDKECVVCPKCGKQVGELKTSTDKNIIINNNNNNSASASAVAGGMMMPMISPKSRLMALLLCIFLGFLGIHRFYAGKAGTGIIMILLMCTGIGEIWWLVDLIMILCGSFRDGVGLKICNW